MVRATKKKDNVGPINPETEERNRLKKLAFSIPNNTLSDKPPSKSDYLPLYPSKTVVKHHGKDILKKSQRKNRFLFSFPGLLAPIAGGKIGELKDLGTKNPILYLDFPQGQMKLFGTIVYPKNRYLTLQFSRGGKNVMCEDCFDTMIVFCDAWWIGKKEENPDEARLEFPKELNEGPPVEYDFKGGASGISEIKQGGIKAVLKHIEEESPKSDSEDDLSNGENISSDLTKTTPARQSARTAGKRFNFADQSPGSSVDSDADRSEDEIKVDTDMGKNNSLFSAVLDVDNEVKTPPTGKNPVSTISVTKSKKTFHTAAQVIKSEEKSGRTHSSLVQSTISTLFKKAEEKKTPTDSRKSQSRVSVHKLEHGNSKRKADKAASPRKKSKVNEEPKVGAENTARKKQSEDEDDIEDFSSSSQDDTVESDEDWAA